jgi:hypothetical protein
MMLCSMSIASCTHKLAPSVPASDATVQCVTDCWSVSKSYVKEHANLFNEVIKLRAALAACREGH